MGISTGPIKLVVGRRAHQIAIGRCVVGLPITDQRVPGSQTTGEIVGALENVAACRYGFDHDHVPASHSSQTSIAAARPQSLAVRCSLRDGGPARTGHRGERLLVSQNASPRCEASGAMCFLG